MTEERVNEIAELAYDLAQYARLGSDYTRDELFLGALGILVECLTAIIQELKLAQRD